VDGMVIDADDNSVAGASVGFVPYSGEMSVSQVAKASKKYTATTAEDGAYNVSNVGIGNYYLIVQKDGYEAAVMKLIITSTNTTSVYKAATVIGKDRGFCPRNDEWSKSN